MPGATSRRWIHLSRPTNIDVLAVRLDRETRTPSRPPGGLMQVPAPFAYARASSVEHALDLLAKYGPEARVVAGGHSLIPMMKLRLATPEALIDINDLTDLSYIRVDGDALAIGAMTRHAELLASPVAGQHFPIFHDA